MHVEERKVLGEIGKITSPLRFKFWSFLKFPASRFAGLRIDKLDSESCVVSVPGGWRTQNPFKTMYWAVQGMGAELATGAVPFAISRSMSEKLRMFVVGTEAKFVKRAKGRIKFTCDEAMKAREAIEESMKTGEPIEIDLRSVGRDDSGEVVSEWIFRWNFLVLERS